MLMSLSLIPVSLSNETLSPLVCLLPEEPPLLVVFGPLGAALEDEVIEVGAGAAGDAQDVEGADLLALMLVPMLYLLHALRLLRSCASLVIMQRRPLIFVRSCCDVPVYLLSQLLRPLGLCLSSAGLSGCG